MVFKRELLYILFIVMFFSVKSYSKPTAHYYFSHTPDEGLKDLSGNGNEGSIYIEADDGAWQNVDGSAAVLFSAPNDKIGLPFKAFPKDGGLMYVSVKLDDANAESILWSVDTTADRLTLGLKDNRLFLTYYQQKTNEMYSAFMSGKIELGKWYDIEACWDFSDAIHILVDGESVAKTEINAIPNFPDVDGTMTIGNGRSGGKAMRGFIREFKLLNNAILTQKAVEKNKIFGQDEIVSLGNSYLRLDFSKDYLIPAGAMNSSENIKLLCDSFLPDEMLLWQIEFMTESGKGRSFVLNNLSVVSDRQITKEKTADGQRLSLFWNNLYLPDSARSVNVIVTVDLPDDSAFSYWKIKIDNNDEKWCLWNVDFPIMSFANPVKSDLDETFLALPYRWGILDRDPFGTKSKDKKEKSRNFSYPSNMHMQFFAIYSKSAGIYFATYDPEGYNKDHLMTSIPLRNRIVHRISHVVSDRGRGVHDFHLSYPIVFGTYKGDWYDACQIYRNWALNQPWCSKGPLATRKDVPDWLKDSQLFVKNSTQLDRPLNNNAVGYNRIIDEFGSNVTSMWYSWWEIDSRKSAIPTEADPLKIGSCNGQLYKPLTGLPEIISKLRERDARVFAYIQSKVYDQGPEPLNDEAQIMQPARISGINNEKFLYNNSTFPCWVMCRATEQWQDRVIELSEIAVRDGYFSGVYLDSFGRDSRECYDPSHGHELGVGSYACTGQHRLAQRVREAIRKIDPEACTGSEASIEFFIDVIDAKLLHFTVLSDECPLWQTVYHDYQLYYGRSIARGGAAMDRTDWDSLEDTFRMKVGNLFIMGAGVGRVYAFQNPPFPFAQTDKNQLEFLRQLIKLKKDCKEFLTLGKALRPAKMIPEPEPFYSIIRNQKLMRPSILTSSWRSYNGKSAIVLLNITKEPHNVSIEFNAVEYGFSPSTKLSVLRRTSDATSELSILSSEKVQLEESLSPTQAVILELSSNN